MRTLFGVNFLRGIFKMPLIWQAWMLVLLTVNGIIPIFFLPHHLAVITLTAMISGLFIGFVLAEVHGFTKLLGIMHGPWIPLFILQCYSLWSGGENISGTLFLWLVASTVITFSSLVLDVLDVVAFTRGNRTDLLKM
ncbi:hypothetical protein [Veronia pacifica]|uniref:Uncharacterized protein n=1 Tax=Veronia pacifica TaxID=1080227 RepID=A0A1C3EIJ5_9GAMM|nr:hypothetical protein [Veronia pacifica]ODA33043.1 hypothetical protein A8L45_12195 [Veronia pacifica]